MASRNTRNTRDVSTSSDKFRERRPENTVTEACGPVLTSRCVVCLQGENTDELSGNVFYFIVLF